MNQINEVRHWALSWNSRSHATVHRACAMFLLLFYTVSAMFDGPLWSAEINYRNEILFWMGVVASNLTFRSEFGHEIWPKKRVGEL